MTPVKRCLFAALFCVLTFWSAVSLFAADPTPAARGLAAEEFRRGVQSYYRGSFNDAILQFEKALSWLPNENLILDWLGQSYYRSGIEGAAIQQWEFAIANGYGGLLLKNKVELIRDRRITGNDFEETARYVEAGAFPGKQGDVLYYSQPISILPQNDASCWVLAYGSNELIRFDVNGALIERTRGPITGFDRPMDIIRQSNGNLLVSEFAGNRISQLSPTASYIKSFGQKGLGVGELLGPQYLAEDSSGNIYVTDFGNARVAAFDAGGKALFTFGTKTPFFRGLQAPVGIAVVHDLVYVSDAVAGTIYIFDTSGNYIDILVPEATLKKPEAMKYWGNYLLVADTNRVLAVDTSSGAVFEASRTGNSPSRITCAVPDINGNLLVSDFKSGEVYVMSKMSELVGGFFVQIERVISDNFPNVTLEVRVENRKRQPVIGLTEKNFFVTEEKRSVSNQKLSGISSLNDVCDITLLIDRNQSMGAYTEQLQASVREIVQAMQGKGTVRIVSAGKVPVLEYKGSPAGLINFSAKSLKTPLSSVVALDQGVRLAANDLVTAEKKRAIVFITSGQVSQNSFNTYGLSDLTAYLNNNGISFATVNVGRSSLPPEVDYLTRQTRGSEYFVYRPEGLRSLVSDLLSLPVGVYQISYTSSLPTDFGRAFLPVEVETYLLNRSGRTESGYFAPLQ